MSIIAHFQYSSKEKLRIVNMYRNGRFSINSICSRYRISKATLMRRNRKFDGSIQSLDNLSRRPKLMHPNAHTPKEIEKIINLIKRNPHIGLTELYSKLRVQINYSRCYSSLYRFLVKTGHYKKNKTVYKVYKPKKYFTPELLAEKMQLDVKYVPRDCNANLQDDYKYYQYTIIDEASRERFIWRFIGNLRSFYDVLCNELNIEHKLIRPRTPRHNGKVERSHRNDNVRFYQYLKFYSFDDLQNQMASYLKRSNNICMTPLNYKTPIEKRKELISQNKVFIRN